jgi:hypothetical protein
VRKSDYILNWEGPRAAELKALTDKGILPVQHDLDTKPDDEELLDNAHAHLMGIVAGTIEKRQSAKEIVNEIVDGAAKALAMGSASLVGGSKL